MNKEDVLEFAHSMEVMGFSDDEIDSYLEHYGVRGMRWGVHRQRRLERAQRVGAGTGSRRDRIGFMLTDTSRSAVGRAGGIEGAARVRVRELESRRERIQSGRALTRDLLMLVGGDRLAVTGSAYRQEGERIREITNA